MRLAAPAPSLHHVYIFTHSLQQHHHRSGARDVTKGTQGRCGITQLLRSGVNPAFFERAGHRANLALNFQGVFPEGRRVLGLSKAAAAGTASPQLCWGRAARVLFSWRRKGRTREVEKGEGFGSWRSNPALGLGMSLGCPVSSHSSLLTPQM